MTSKSDFVDKCLWVCKQTTDGIIKDVIKQRLESIVNDPTLQSIGEMPSDASIIEYVPDMNTFPDYVFSMCKLKSSKEEIVRYTLGHQYDNIVTRKRRRIMEDEEHEHMQTRSRSTRSRSRASRPQVESEPVEVETRSVLQIIRGPQMPGILSVFTKKNPSTGQFVALTNQDEIVKNYFPECKSYSKGVYIGEKSMVIVTTDSKDKWSSCGIQNKVLWNSPKEDILDILSTKTDEVYVIRKRNNEIRYMGKCINVNSINKVNLTCEMFVA